MERVGIFTVNCMILSNNIEMYINISEFNLTIIKKMLL